MEFEQRLNHLESVRDWQGLAEELEKGIAAEADPVKKAAHHLRLGRILEEKFLQAVKALKHFQDAYKLNPALMEALQQARSIYWDLGKSNMVQRLLEIELKGAGDGPAAAELLVELGDVLADIGDHEKAAGTYARALGASGGTSDEARACLEDVQVDESSWEQHLAGMLSQASGGSLSPQAQARIFVRGARIAKRFALTEVEGLLTRAYEANPSNKQAAALLESKLVEEDKAQTIVDM